MTTGGCLVIPRRPIDALVDLVDRLLGPGGCPWDQEQTHETLSRHLLEESYELIDAIDAKDFESMKEELGDVLLQPIMHSQIRKQNQGFDADDVAEGIVDKLIRRHPHVFGDAVATDSAEVLKNWDKIKQTEKKRSVLAGVPRSLPSLLRAHEISKRAARQGFEWENLEGVLEKLEEERAELLEAISHNDPGEIESELGDLLFTVVNIARWTKVDAETALRKMLDRFSARFQAMEETTTKELTKLSPSEWDDLWKEAKQQTR